MIMLLLVGFLLFGGIALMLLDAAIEHAEEGYEDESGFHQETHHWTVDPSSPEAGITLWDQVEGACCPLDMTPSFRPVGNNPFTHGRQ
jgi:hypothetical protein